MTELRIIRMKELTKKVGLSQSWLYGQISKGEFPQPVRMAGSRACGWLSSDIDKWLLELEKVDPSDYAKENMVNCHKA